MKMIKKRFRKCESSLDIVRSYASLGSQHKKLAMVGFLGVPKEELYS